MTFLAQRPLKGLKWVFSLCLLATVVQIFFQIRISQVHLQNSCFEPFRGLWAKNVITMTPLKIKFYIKIDVYWKFFWPKIFIYGKIALFKSVFAWFHLEFLNVPKFDHTQNVPWAKGYHLKVLNIQKCTAHSEFLGPKGKTLRETYLKK